MQIWAESGKSALPICNYSQILYQFLTFTQNLKRSLIIPKPPGKIYAIFKKPMNSPLYTQLTYHTKNLKITKKCLPQTLVTQIEPSLLEDT